MAPGRQGAPPAGGGCRGWGPPSPAASTVALRTQPLPGCGHKVPLPLAPRHSCDPARMSSQPRQAQGVGVLRSGWSWRHRPGRPRRGDAAPGSPGRGGPAALGVPRAGQARWSLLSSPGDDGSGSGSGEGCPDNECGRRVSKKGSSSRTPLSHALPGLSEQGGQKTSATGCPRPCTCLLLLSVLTLVLSAARPRWR